MSVFINNQGYYFQAPRITHVPNVQPQINTSFGLFSTNAGLNPYAHIEPQGTKESLFFLSRRLPANKKEISGISKFRVLY